MYLSLFQLVDEEKTVVMTEMEKLLALCQQLQMGAKTPVQGKAATFQKVTILHLSVFLSLFLLVSALFIRKKRNPVTYFCLKSVRFGGR